MATTVNSTTTPGLVTFNTSSYGGLLNTTNATYTGHGGTEKDEGAFLYIVVVLCIYAICLIILLIKYVKSENREAVLNYYYQEFVKRDRFKEPRVEQRCHNTPVLYVQHDEELQTPPASPSKPLLTADTKVTVV